MLEIFITSHLFPWVNKSNGIIRTFTVNNKKVYSFIFLYSVDGNYTFVASYENDRNTRWEQIKATTNWKKWDDENYTSQRMLAHLTIE